MGPAFRREGPLCRTPLPPTARVGGDQALICPDISAADTGKQAGGQGTQEEIRLWTWGPDVWWAPPLHRLWFDNPLIPLRKRSQLGLHEGHSDWVTRSAYIMGSPNQ